MSLRIAMICMIALACFTEASVAGPGAAETSAAQRAQSVLHIAPY